MSKSRTGVLRVVAVAALVAGGIVGTSPAAYALPGTCDEHAIANGYYVYCGTGSGQYRAAITCWYNHGTASRNRFGVWRSPNGTHSEVSCTSAEELGGYWTEKKN